MYILLLLEKAQFSPQGASESHAEVNQQGNVYIRVAGGTFGLSGSKQHLEATKMSRWRWKLHTKNGNNDFIITILNWIKTVGSRACKSVTEISTHHFLFVEILLFLLVLLFTKRNWKSYPFSSQLLVAISNWVLTFPITRKTMEDQQSPTVGKLNSNKRWNFSTQKMSVIFFINHPKE